MEWYWWVLIILIAAILLGFVSVQFSAGGK